MDLECLHDLGVEGVSASELDTGLHNETANLPSPPVVIIPALLLSACGGGGGSSGESGAVIGAAPSPVTPIGAAPTPAAPAAPTAAPPPTATQAGRFLAQSTMGAIPSEISAVSSQGYDGWLSAQFNKPRSSTFWNWLIANGYNAPVNAFREAGHDPMVWNALITGEDQLRQRVGTALLSIFVVGINAIPNSWKQFGMAAYMDILWDNAFGNYRTLLDKVSMSPVMAFYLTFINNKKANANGAMPDENYAREVMQLFTIGLNQLNPDGTEKLVGGKTVETYTLSDVTGLARVFTGWKDDKSKMSVGYENLNLPMIQVAADYETGAKSFLGVTIPAGTSAADSMKIALDTLFAHPNTAPFVSKQLIQRLVTSNPSPAYVRRVAAAFENNGSGVRGDMRAVIRAILLDPEARNDAAALSSTTFGKLREPVIRFTGWARAFGATSPSNGWGIGDTTGHLSQAIGRSPSVFNFFRPGYVPPNSMVATKDMVAPEYQITNEQTVVNYINFMALSMRDGWGDVKANYTEYLAIAGNSQALLDLINLRLAANQVSAATLAQIKTAVDSIATTTPADMLNRVFVATLAIMASPEFLILK